MKLPTDAVAHEAGHVRLVEPVEVPEPRSHPRRVDLGVGAT